MLVPIRMGTNMAAGNQQKHLSLSFATKAKEQPIPPDWKHGTEKERTGQREKRILKTKGKNAVGSEA